MSTLMIKPFICLWTHLIPRDVTKSMSARTQHPFTPQHSVNDPIDVRSHARATGNQSHLTVQPQCPHRRRARTSHQGSRIRSLSLGFVFPSPLRDPSSFPISLCLFTSAYKLSATLTISGRILKPKLPTSTSILFSFLKFPKSPLVRASASSFCPPRHPRECHVKFTLL